MKRTIAVAIIVAVAAFSAGYAYAASTLWSDMDALMGAFVTDGINRISHYGAMGCVSASWSATLANGQPAGGGIGACH